MTNTFETQGAGSAESMTPSQEELKTVKFSPEASEKKTDVFDSVPERKLGEEIDELEGFDDAFDSMQKTPREEIVERLAEKPDEEFDKAFEGMISPEELEAEKDRKDKVFRVSLENTFLDENMRIPNEWGFTTKDGHEITYNMQKFIEDNKEYLENLYRKDQEKLVESNVVKVTIDGQDYSFDMQEWGNQEELRDIEAQQRILKGFEKKAETNQMHTFPSLLADIRKEQKPDNLAFAAADLFHNAMNYQKELDSKNFVEDLVKQEGEDKASKEALELAKKVEIAELKAKYEREREATLSGVSTGTEDSNISFSDEEIAGFGDLKAWSDVKTQIDEGNKDKED